MEQKAEDANVFEMSIGNLPPSKSAILTLTYVTELEIDNGAVTCILPTEQFWEDGIHKASSSKEYTEEVPDGGISVKVSYDMSSV